MQLQHRLSTWLGALLLVFVVLMSSQPALAGDKAESKKASFDAIPASKSPILQFRSVAIGVVPAQIFEMDYYLASKWGLGATLFREFNDCYDTTGPCRESMGLGAHIERYFGGRWAHIGLRAGVFTKSLVAQTHSASGSPVARNGRLIGPQLGLSATFTPTRATGVTVALLGMPGLFEGFKTHEFVQTTNLNEDNSEPTRELLITGMLTIGLRFGVLDGPDPLCRCCRDGSLPCGE